VIVLKPTVLNDTVAEVRWELVEHSKKGDTFEGPYAAALNTHKDAVYTPYNRGGWKYDKSAGTIKYWVATDPGGSLPAFMQTQGAMMAFPKELLKVKWGVKAD
jgi:hypothetical protein